MPVLPPDEQLLLRLRARFGKAMQDYGLVQDGDHVLIGLSGGKDSLALVELLGERSRIFKPKFSVSALHVSLDNVPYQADLEYLKAFCESHHTVFHHCTGHFEPDTDDKRGPCFLCSWTRRKKLFETAKALGCNKIALGHHQDDILTTLLMNMTFQGAFSTMPPYLKMQKTDVDLIRPLALCRESDLQALARLRGYRKQARNCPYETVSHRADMKALLQQLETLHPEAAASLWGAMTNIQTDYLPKKIQP